MTPRKQSANVSAKPLPEAHPQRAKRVRKSVTTDTVSMSPEAARTYARILFYGTPDEYTQPPSRLARFWAWLAQVWT